MQLSTRLKPIIADLLTRNTAAQSNPRGGAFCAEIERPPDGEPWVQVKTGVLNIFYPADEEPLTMLSSLVPLPESTSRPAWEPWKYATLEFDDLDAVTTAQLVERLFVNFHEFPADTEVATEIFDMR